MMNVLCFFLYGTQKASNAKIDASSKGGKEQVGK